MYNRFLKNIIENSQLGDVEINVTSEKAVIKVLKIR